MKSIYIACPAGLATGGPELLHQLCYKLNQFGYQAFMYYYNVPEEYQGRDVVHPNYRKYNAPYVFSYPDLENQLLIVPEIVCDVLEECQKGQPILWWLSLDNYFKYLNRIGLNPDVVGNDPFHLRNSRVIHFVQCYYVKDFVEQQLQIPPEQIFYLSDYLNPQFKNNVPILREDYIVYNPKKGMEFTQKLIDAAPDLHWVPIQNMTPEQVSRVLHAAKLYIDFGPHPGKDRLPREAALSGCCIVTNRQGSANYAEDVPIPDNYKFDHEQDRIPEILSTIRDIVTHYETHVKNFGRYRLWIQKEEREFDSCIKKIFPQLCQ